MTNNTPHLGAEHCVQFIPQFYFLPRWPSKRFPFSLLLSHSFLVESQKNQPFGLPLRNFRVEHSQCRFSFLGTYANLNHANSSTEVAVRNGNWMDSPEKDVYLTLLSQLHWLSSPKWKNNYGSSNKRSWHILIPYRRLYIMYKEKLVASQRFKSKCLSDTTARL